MDSYPRLRTWLAAHSDEDEPFLDAQQVALFIADGGWSAPRADDAEITAAVAIDDQVVDGIVELRGDGLYYTSTSTAERDNQRRVTVIDATTGEAMAQGWREVEGTVETTSEDVARPFIATRPSGLSDGRAGGGSHL